MCMFIVWYSSQVSRLHNLHPWYWNSLLYCLISSWERSVHFLQLMPFTILQFSFQQVPITTGWAEAVWNEKFAWHFYTWLAVGIEPQSFWSWVQHPIHWATCSHTLPGLLMYFSAIIIIVTREGKMAVHVIVLVQNRQVKIKMTLKLQT